MDPITHGLLGAAVAQTTMWRKVPHGLRLIGAASAMAPDLDVFIFSLTDPTVGWVYHRHFTHSLFFIPFGGLLAALPFLLLQRYAGFRRAVIVAATIGYATHTLLDSLTSYGTQQLLPFLDWRVAWDAMAIVDPVFTLILIAGLLITARSKQMAPVRVALAAACLYVCFGFWQHQRAVDVQQELTALRGHKVTHARVMPAPGWLVLWRSVYLAGGRLYSDGIRVPWVDEALVAEGGAADAVTLSDLPPQVQASAEAQRSFAVLNWFADGLLAPVEGQAAAVGDMRITATVEGLTPLWGLQFTANGAPQRWEPPPGVRRDLLGVLRLLLSGDARYRPVSSLRQVSDGQPLNQPVLDAQSAIRGFPQGRRTPAPKQNSGASQPDSRRPNRN